MDKAILIDITVIQPNCPKRGIPKVIDDIVFFVLNSEKLLTKIKFVVETRNKEFVCERYPGISQNLLLIANNPIKPFLFTGALCDFRMKFNKDQFSMIFLPYFNSVCYHSEIPQVVLIYDVYVARNWWKILMQDYSFHPKNWIIMSFMLYKHFKIRFADRFLCISNFTKKELEDLIPSTKNRTDVIPLALKQFSRYEITNMEKKFQKLSNNEFLLYIGGFESRKNVYAMIEDIGTYCAREGILLVLAGSITPIQMQKVINLTDRLKLNDTIVLFGNVSEPSVSYLLDRASIFVFYSKYEGFGLPLIEAMAKKVPVVAFANSAINEVVANAGYLAKNGDKMDFIRGVEKIRKSQTLRDEFVNAGVKVAMHYSVKNFTNTLMTKLKHYKNEFT